MNKKHFLTIIIILIAVIFIGLMLANNKKSSEAQTQSQPQPQQNNQPAQPAQIVDTNPAFSTLIQMQESNPEEVVILDVRTPDEFAQGHMEGAVNIDFYAPEFQENLQKLDKNKTYFLYCRSGNRAGQTLELMKQMGFENVINLGSLQDLQANGIELVQ